MRIRSVIVALFAAACQAAAADLKPPENLPRYDFAINLDVAGHQAHVTQNVRWTNTSTKPVEQLVVPAAAVVRDGNEEQVYVEQPDGYYRAVRVKLGAESDGMRVVLSGVKAGDRIVVGGAFHLDNERKRLEQG